MNEDFNTEFINDRPDIYAYEDPKDEGNSSKYHTGKKCIVPGCKKPAGTYWSYHWCFDHNVERIRRITLSLEDMEKNFNK